jgi:hypothetical protein
VRKRAGCLFFELAARLLGGTPAERQTLWKAEAAGREQSCAGEAAGMRADTRAALQFDSLRLACECFREQFSLADIQESQADIREEAQALPHAEPAPASQ